MTVVNSYRYLAGDKCTDDGVRLAMILGWCVEWVSVRLIDPPYVSLNFP